MFYQTTSLSATLRQLLTSPCRSFFSRLRIHLILANVLPAFYSVGLAQIPIEGIFEVDFGDFFSKFACWLGDVKGHTSELVVNFPRSMVAKIAKNRNFPFYTKILDTW